MYVHVVYMYVYSDKDNDAGEKKHAFIADDRLEIFQYSNSEKDSDFDVSSEAHNSFGHVVVTDYGKDKIYMLDSDG